ncbi:MAG: hypothetical protein ABIQ30_09755 [Devosia sp.]
MNILGVEVPLAAMAGFLSATIAGVAALLVWLQWRERQFRKDDVLKWANEVISNLQTLYILLFLGKENFGEEAILTELKTITIRTSVLVEQGRLFFRNKADGEHGKDKHGAYQGYRAELLDPIVVAHQIAAQWDTADIGTRRRMTLIAEDCVRRFVSFAQMEVGRSRTVSIHTARAGRGDHLGTLMEALSADRIEALRSRERNSL